MRERDNSSYRDQIKFIDEDPEDALAYGIKHKCTFSELSYFSVPDAFPSDIMHDCLEGVIPRTVELIRKDLYKECLVSIKELNEALVHVKLPVSDKPNLFSDDFFSSKGKIVGTASQKLELLLVPPQLVDLSTVGDTAAWDVYILLRKCMDYILSPVIEKDALPYLASLIQSYLLKFRDKFGAESLMPKHHFMMH